MDAASQVLALAPDAAGAKAGQALASVLPWSELRQDERAVWGLCQGSGKKPYQTQVDLSEPAFKCSCPSRKFPCKHALGLLLLRATDDAAVLRAPARPEWQAVQRDIVLCVDQSGSMASSVVCSSVFAAVLASLLALRTSLAVFDTAVVDLTPQLADPVEVLFGTQLGGGTDINQARA